MTGKTFAHYQITGSFVYGALGEVYLAQDTELDRKVALKILSEDLIADSETVSRFQREARVAAGIHHPNIMTIYAVETHEGRPFVAMEYVEGSSLAEMLTSGPLGVETAIDVASQICAGLGESHRQGASYGGLGAEDVLVGTNGRVRILSLGRVQWPEKSTSLLDETVADIMQDTPTVALMNQTVDPAADLASLGVLLTRMIGGPEAGAEPSCDELARKILASSSHRLSRNERDSIGPLCEIVGRALAAGAAAPYSSVRAMAEDLRRLPASRSSDTVFVPARPRLRRRPVIAAVLVSLLAVVVVVAFVRRPAPDTAERKKVVVLPFENLGAPEDEYFADGVTAEITARISALKGIGVISRTSAARYAGIRRPLRDIAAELGVGYVIEGTIRWDKSGSQDRVRITPQLIRAADDTRLWGDTYERELHEVFAVQTDIAVRIADALDVTLLEREHTVLTENPTENVEAYQAYLKGLKALWATDFSRELFDLSIQMFERAIALDPDFALAYARLSAAYSRSAHYGFDRSERHLAEARSLAERALELRPDLAEAHVAMGLYHYWCERDYAQALGSLAAALAFLDANAEILQTIGYVKRRLGDMEESAAILEQSLELDPVNALTYVAIGEVHSSLRNYVRADRFLRQARSLAPDQAYPYTELAMNHLRWRGDTAAARAVLDSLPVPVGTEPYRVRFFVELLAGDDAAALACLDASPEPVFEAGVFFTPISLLRGTVHRLRGDDERAEAAFTAARDVLERKLAAAPDDHRVLSALGLALAGLGEAEAAVGHGERAVALYSVDMDALEGPTLLIDLALIKTMVGDHQGAILHLEELLSIPSIVSSAWLEIDPRWDPLREHREFLSLLERHGRKTDL